MKRNNQGDDFIKAMFSLTLHIGKFCWMISYVMGRDSARSISLTSGAFSGSCGVSHNLRNHFKNQHPE